MVVSLCFMTEERNYLIVDAGNTRIKVAHYQQEELLNLSILETAEMNRFSETISAYPYSCSILSSVCSEAETESMRSKLKNCLLLKDAKLPIEIDYDTPQTLGADRIANAVAIAHLSKTAALSIDIGTCIKCDFVDAEKRYLGGSISPGIKLRYRSLNDYTAALPLLDDTESENLIGKDTRQSISSGVLNGIRGEITFFMNNYLELHPNLTIFMTGGDAPHFDYSRKKNIFAIENLTLYGLLLILKANAK